MIRENYSDMQCISPYFNEGRRRDEAENEISVVTKLSYRMISSVREWAMQKDYVLQYGALDMILDLKTDEKHRFHMRQDKITPAVLHEVSQNLYTIVLLDTGYKLRHPEVVLVTQLMHDVIEDFIGFNEQIIAVGLRTFWARHNTDYLLSNSGIKPVDFESVRSNNYADLARIADAVKCVSKNDAKGSEFYDSKEEYYQVNLNHEINSVVKLLDVLSNKCTQNGVKKKSRIISDIEFTKDVIIPLIGEAIQNYPDQSDVYYEIQDEMERVDQINAGQPDKVDWNQPSAFTRLPDGIRPATVALNRYLNNPDHKVIDCPTRFQKVMGLGDRILSPAIL